MPMSSRDNVYNLLRKAANHGMAAVTAEYIAQQAGIDRSTASRYLNELVREGRVQRHAGRPARFSAIAGGGRAAGAKLESDFGPIIGYDGSLTSVIRDAQAAVSYPARKMYCILIGPSGSGKTMLARMIYEFGVSKGVFRPGHFVSFNCADYASNPQLLFSQLYGHVKDAFTGAGAERAGLVDKASGGVLFLDEVHRLPPEGQEMLFSLMDSGTYSRLGSTDQMAADVFVIAATSENLDSSLLGTFLRRFPVRLIMPGFKERPASERVSLALSFLQQEATRLNEVIAVRREIIEEVCSTDYRGNVRELRNRIQLSVARAYLKSMVSPGAGLSLSRGDLAASPVPNVDREIAMYARAVLPATLVFLGESDSGTARRSGEVDFCAFMNDRLAVHRAKGIPEAEVMQLVDAELRGLLWTLDASPRRGTAPVEGNLLDAIKEALDQLQAATGRKVLATASLWLAAHLSSVIRMVQNGTYDSSHWMFKESGENEVEYRIAQDLVRQVRRIGGVPIPAQETHRLAVLIKSVCREDDGCTQASFQSDLTGAPRLVVFCLTGEKAAQICKERIVTLGFSPNDVCTVPENHPLVRGAMGTSATFIGPFNPGVPADRFIRMDEVFKESEGALRERLGLGRAGLRAERLALVQAVLRGLGRSVDQQESDSVATVAYDLARRLEDVEHAFHVDFDDGLFAAMLLHFVASVLKGRELDRPAASAHRLEAVMRLRLEPAELDLLCRVCNI